MKYLITLFTLLLFVPASSFAATGTVQFQSYKPHVLSSLFINFTGGNHKLSSDPDKRVMVGAEAGPVQYQGQWNLNEVNVYNEATDSFNWVSVPERCRVLHAPQHFIVKAEADPGHPERYKITVSC